MSLSFIHVEDLEYFPDERMKGLASLKRVDIRDCPALRYLSPWILYLTSLEDLYIFDCKEFEGIKWPETPSLTRLRVLQLLGLPKLKNVLPPGIQHLTSLEALRIIECEELQVSNDDSIEWQALTTLRFLYFNSLPQLVSLPWGLQFLTTLKQLHILYCRNFTGLPDWICKLSSLETLHIWRCPKFKSVPASISSLTSLHKLEINGQDMNPREIHELSCSASATGELDTSTASGSRSWKILKKFRRLQLCNK
ncbi:hypothetical protein TIFTF001_027629 [Ficus carica]|uniref:Disease resistance R13L4/SHOC-2-like LRR domain-containing protein n=1 Tax=Ficus carica TaxID=3494 RepID=A0AA88DNK1_FICCA|nr:hypothetical protein TIFTF001_027629 [Ficus carica]